MAVELKPININFVPSTKSVRLREIADVLGVSTEAFSAPMQLQALHTADDGSTWVLDLDHIGTPVVRHAHNIKSEKYISEENISEFLLHDIGSPQHTSLILLINRMIYSHIMNEDLSVLLR